MQISNFSRNKGFMPQNKSKSTSFGSLNIQGARIVAEKYINRESIELPNQLDAIKRVVKRVAQNLSNDGLSPVNLKEICLNWYGEGSDLSSISSRTRIIDEYGKEMEKHNLLKDSSGMVKEFNYYHGERCFKELPDLDVNNTEKLAEEAIIESYNKSQAQIRLLNERKELLKQNPNLKFLTYSQDDLDRIYNYGESGLNEDYYDSLKYFVTKVGYKPIEGKPQNIVLMGCGHAFEASGVNSYFGGKKFGELSDDVKIFGLDIDEDSIRYANNYYRNFLNFKFLPRNNLDLPKIEQIPKELDVVTFKGPLILGKDFKSYNQMVKQSYDVLRKDGLLISSFYTGDDEYYFRKIMENLNLKSETGGSSFIIIKKK